MTTLEVLRAARERLTDPANWCGMSASDGRGAVCIAIAVSDVYGDSFWQAAHRVLARLLPDGGEYTAKALHNWNDHHATSHADVLALLDRAIANEEAQAQEFSVEPIREVERV